MNQPAIAVQNLNNLELNKGDNFIFAIDVSGSMAAADCPAGMSRIEFLKEKTIMFAQEASKWDEDGIDVITFGHQVIAYTGVTGDKASELIGKFSANEGSTDTAGAIKKAWELSQGKEQTVLFIATDGEPNNREAVKQVIIDITNKVTDERQFNISFLTVGIPTPSLQQFLVSLDDDMKGAKYDIVDVKKLEEVDFMTAFLSSLND